MQAATVSEQQDTSNMGRPRLAEGTESKPITFKVPAPLREESDGLARGERSEALRAFLSAYMNLPEAERWRARDPDILAAALQAAVKISESLDH